MKTTPSTPPWLTHSLQIGLGLVAIVALGYVLAPFIPLGQDWRATFHGLNLQWPYAHNATAIRAAAFFNPPWLVLFIPHSQLDMAWGNAINFLLNLIVPMLVIARMGGGYRAMVLVFFSPFYMQTVAVNNVDWVPLLAFLVPPQLALLCLACKPQAVGGAALIILRQSVREKRWSVWWVPLVGVALSLLIWPGWPLALLAPDMDAAFNISPFPVLVPLGLWLLWRAWQEDDMVIAASATPLLVPFVTLYSLTTLMTVLVCRYPRMAFIVWVVGWLHAGIVVRQFLF